MRAFTPLQTPRLAIDYGRNGAGRATPIAEGEWPKEGRMRRLGEVRWEVGFWQFVDILRRAEGPGASKRASNGNGTPARPVKFPPRSGMAPSLRLLVITQNPWRHSRFSNAKIAIIISQS